jgi:hypothetical protein
MNKSAYKNKDVVKPTANGIDLTARPRNMWIIDFGVDLSLSEAQKYELPFQHLLMSVKPEREKSREAGLSEKWWLFARPRPEMRQAISPLKRFIVTPKTSKHRIFVWFTHPTLPDQALTVIAREDDYFMGVLHSRAHEVWVLNRGTTLEDRPRYSLSMTFETFPFPSPPGKEPIDDPCVKAIAAHAIALDEFRTGWLKSVEGQVGVTISEKVANRYTLTNLYNALTLYREEYKGRQRDPRVWAGASYGDIISLEQIETLDHIHTRLDQSVLEAYGWPHNLSDEGILERLLALNLERAGMG